MAGARTLRGNSRKEISRMALNEEHAGSKDGTNWDQESVRTEKPGKNSNLMASKAGKSETEGEERTEETGNDE